LDGGEENIDLSELQLLDFVAARACSNAITLFGTRKMKRTGDNCRGFAAF
jgi:hypothetical protein